MIGKTLATALHSGDEDAINIAVVKSFFEEHDPSRVDEAEELLMAHKGREEQLMEALNEQYPQLDDVKDFIEEASEKSLRSEEIARPASFRREADSSMRKVASTRITGLTLSVTLGEGLAVPTLEASVQKNGDSGFILSGAKADRTSHKFTVNPTSHDADQARVLRERMAQKGVKSEVIDAIVGDTSEML